MDEERGGGEVGFSFVEWIEVREGGFVVLLFPWLIRVEFDGREVIESVTLDRVQEGWRVAGSKHKRHHLIPDQVRKKSRPLLLSLKSAWG